MRFVRLVPGVLAAVLLAAAALPGRADQIFWTLSTGPVPTPRPAAADAAGIDSLYYYGSYGYQGYPNRRGRHNRRFGRNFENVPRRPHRVNPPGGGIYPQIMRPPAARRPMST